MRALPILWQAAIAQARSVLRSHAHDERTRRDETPAALGFSMPAEWEPHEATWLGWPHNPTDWPDKLDTIRWVYGEMVRKIAPGEMVRILVDSAAEEKLARRYLARAGADAARACEFVVHPTNRGWTRDSGPVFVRAAGRPADRDRHRPLPLQRLGQVPRLAEGPPRAGDRGHAARQAAVRRAACDGRDVRPRRRRHRRQRPRHAADHRGVLPRSRRRRCAIPGLGREDFEAALQDVSGRDERVLAGGRRRRATTRTATSTTSAGS